MSRNFARLLHSKVTLRIHAGARYRRALRGWRSAPPSTHPGQGGIRPPTPPRVAALAGACRPSPPAEGALPLPSNPPPPGRPHPASR